jgi:hypothetical protein
MTLENGFVHTGQTGGAILVGPGGGIVLTSCAFTPASNNGGSGGAIAVSTGASALLTSCSFTNDLAVNTHDDGGAGGARGREAKQAANFGLSPLLPPATH